MTRICFFEGRWLVLMNNYSVIGEYIYKYHKDFYLIVKNKIFYAYDYNHNLLSQTKKLRELEKIFMCDNG